MTSEVLATVIRGETVESIHRGHFIVIDGERNVIASAGDPSTVTFLRSSAKPFQAMPFITSGAADHYAFVEDEIALAVASHSGEKIHVDIAARMLAKIGLSETDLRCGVHLPFYQKEAERLIADGERPLQLHNNCSGKHVAMLALAKHIGADLATYDNLDHPVQQAILKCVSDLTEVPIEDIAIGIDGCGAPNFAMSVSAMAVSFINLIAPPLHFDQPTRLACSRIVAAMTKYPELIGGSERLDTMLMQAAPGKIISKVGADGVWLCAVLPSKKWPTGLAIAIKVEDGDDHRARPVIAVEILRFLGLLRENSVLELSPMPIENRMGGVVGKVVANPI